MTIRTFVTPRPGSGAVNLRSTGKIDPANIVGMIHEGTRLEYFTQTGSWYVGKVYVSTEAAGNQFIKPKASNDFANIRSSPVVENNTDVGDLKQGQQLGLIAMMGEWLVGQVYLPAYITEANPQMKANKLPGWEATNSRWITECAAYLQTWNAAVGMQPVNGVIFYRWAHDEWRLDDKTLILNQIKAEAKKLGIGGSD